MRTRVAPNTDTFYAMILSYPVIPRPRPRPPPFISGKVHFYCHESKHPDTEAHLERFEKKLPLTIFAKKLHYRFQLRFLQPCDTS